MTPRVSLNIYEDATRQKMIADLSAFAQQIIITTREHGFAELTCFVPASLREAFMFYDRSELPHISLNFGGWPVWEGRVEDVSIETGGYSLSAFGYWRAYHDVPYTACWSTNSVADWRVITGDDVTGVSEALYSLDNNNRLYIATVKNNIYTSGGDTGGWCYLTPDKGARDIQYVSFTYDYNLPANWTVRVSAFDSAFGSAIGTNITTAGGTATGSFTWNISGTPRAIISVRIYNSSGSAYTETAETGARYFKATNVRLKSTTSSSVYASEIAAALAAHVNILNPAQAQASAGLIEPTDIDLTEAVFEDKTPAEILAAITAVGDSAGNNLEYGVWNDRYLHLRVRGKYGLEWIVDAAALSVSRSLNDLVNSAYVIYSSTGGRTLRTDANGNPFSQRRYALRRRIAVRVNTTSLTTAGTVRQTVIGDGDDPKPRAEVTFAQLFDPGGGSYPLWLCRSGDSIAVRNLPGALSSAIDRVRRFRVSETRYDVSQNILTVTPELPPPSVNTQLAQLAL